MTNLFFFLDRLFCRHEHVKRADPRSGLLYVQCLKCQATSSGIVTGAGFALMRAKRRAAC